MLKKTLFTAIILTFLFVPLLSINAAQPISITLNQQEFKPGDEIKANVVFTNNFSKPIKGMLLCSFTSLDRGLPPMPQVYEIDLSPGQKSEVFTCAMTIMDTMPDGLYRAEAEMRDEHNNLVTGGFKEFIVIGTKKDIKADLLICADSDCKESKTVFIKGKIVYLKLQAGTVDLQIDAKLQNSQTEEKQNIAFVNNMAEIKAEQAGSFTFNATLNKDGFSEQIIQKDFAVIDAPAKIKSASICNVDGQCAGKENKQNCPQDCLTSKKQPIQADVTNIKTIILIILAIIIIVIITAVYYFLVIKKGKVNL